MIPRIDKGTIEYSLIIGKAIHRETSRGCIRFLFETTEEFHYFQYLITVEQQQTDSEIQFQLLGLRTKGLSLPGNDKARYSYDCFDLHGTQTIKVLKPGDSLNEFQIHISPKRIQLIKNIKQKNPFLSVTIK